MTLHLLGDRIASRRLSYGLAVWDHGFKKRYMTLQLEIDELIVTDYSIYTDDSGRSNHRRTARLRRKTTSPQISKIDPAPSSQDDVSEILKVIFSGARPPDLPATERVFNSETGHHYQRINGPMSWDDAAKYCHNLGGHLATISSDEENEFLYEHFAHDHACWLSATDRGTEGSVEMGKRRALGL